MRKDLTALMREVESRIESLQNDDKYVKQILSFSDGIGGVSSVEDKRDGQLGTAIPKYFGAVDTFISNTSNVSLGIIARMIETDPSVLSSVQFKSLMMLSKVGDYHHDDPKIKEFVTQFLSDMDRPSWGKAKEAQSSFYGYGFSVSEIIWKLNDLNQKVPAALKTYHPTTICFEVDQNGEITENGVVQFVIQNINYSNPNSYMPAFQYGWKVGNPFETPNDRLLPWRLPFIGNYGLQRIPRNKVVHHTNNAMLSFGSPYGKTSVRTAHLAWQMKVFFMKQMGVAGKRQATPFVWATAPQNNLKVKVAMPDGSSVEKSPVQALTEMLATREGDDSIVTGPESLGYKLQSIAAQMDLKQYLDVLAFLDTQIFRSFLLPSLVMTDGSAGSRALGDKHFQIVDRIAEEEAKNFSEEIVSQMVKPAIEMNFGKQKNYGKFIQRPQSIEERERLTNMFVNLANAGYMKAYDKIDGEYVRNSLHLPQQDDSFYVEPSPNFDPMSDEDLQPGDEGYTDDFTKRVKKKIEGDKDE